MGTAAYWAPEVFESTSGPGLPNDMWALGEQAVSGDCECLPRRIRDQRLDMNSSAAGCCFLSPLLCAYEHLHPSLGACVAGAGCLFRMSTATAATDSPCPHPVYSVRGADSHAADGGPSIR